MFCCLRYCSAEVELKREYYPSGKLKSESGWRSNEPYGVWKTYYENGNVEQEHDRLTDLRKEYYKSRALKTESFIGIDKTKRVIKHYYEDGALASIAFFEKNPKGFGFEKHYDRSGNLLFRYKYKNGKIVGIQKVNPVK